MNRIYDFFKKYRLGTLSGLIIGTSYIPFYPWGLFFCYIPLWYFVFFQAKSAKEAFIAGWVTQFTLTLIGFHWVAFTAKEYGGFPWPVAIIVLLLFCALAHIYIPISVYLLFRLRTFFNWNFKNSVVAMILLAFLSEVLWPGIFPWHLGYTLFWSRLPIYQFADVIGFDGLSLLIFAMQGLFFYILCGRIQIITPRALFKPFLVVALPFVLLNIGGYFYGLNWLVTDSEIKILQVQANIGNLEKMYAEKGKGFRDEIVKKYIEMSDAGLKANNDVDLVIWPEVAIPEYLDAGYAHKKNNQLISDFLVRNQKVLLTGGFSKDDKVADPERSVFNALFLLDQTRRELSQPYRKTQLLAFGEYLPFSEQFPFLSKLLPFVSNFGRGQGPTVLVYPIDQTRGDYLMIGAQICYEGLFPEFSVGLESKGAEILVNVTNDSWFGAPFEPYQHLYMTLARSIETRRPLIRSTNTGITTYSSAHGDIAKLSPLHKEWTKRQVVSYRNNPEMTTFTRVGHYLWIVILIAFFLHLLINGIYDKFRKS